MASLLQPLPQPRPHLQSQGHTRPLSAYSLESSTSSGPYLSAYNSNTLNPQRRTSRTFRSSPLAGPVLSYSSLSELDTSTSSESSLCSPGPSTISGCSTSERSGSVKPPQRCKSTGALATPNGDQSGLRPPMPAWTRTSARRSVISVRSSGKCNFSFCPDRVLFWYTAKRSASIMPN